MATAMAFAPSLPAAPVAPLANRLPAASRFACPVVVVVRPSYIPRQRAQLPAFGGGCGGRGGNDGHSWWNGGSDNGGHGRDNGGSGVAALTAAGAGLLARYSNQLVLRPYRTKAITTGLLMLLADYLAQTLTQPNLELTRMLRFLSYGVLIGGPFTHWWFSLIERHCARGILGAVQMAALDQLIGAPVQLACFVLFMHLVQGNSVFGSEDALRQQHLAAFIASCQIWPWVNMFNFAVVPSHFRVVFGSAFNVAWIAFLSMTAANSTCGRSDEAVLADATG